VLSVETTGRPELALEFAESVGVTFPIVSDDSRTVGSLFGIRFTPTNLLIDRDGMVFFTNYGYSPGKEEVYAAQIGYLLGMRGRSS